MYVLYLNNGNNRRRNVLMICSTYHKHFPVFSSFMTYHRVSTRSLNIPKGQSEAISWRRTDKTMAKRKRTKGQTAKHYT